LVIVVSNDWKASVQCIQAYSKALRVLGVVNRSIVYNTTVIIVKLRNIKSVLYKSVYAQICSLTLGATQFTG